MMKLLETRVQTATQTQSFILKSQNYHSALLYWRFSLEKATSYIWDFLSQKKNNTCAIHLPPLFFEESYKFYNQHVITTNMFLGPDWVSLNYRSFDENLFLNGIYLQTLITIYPYTVFKTFIS